MSLCLPQPLQLYMYLSLYLCLEVKVWGSLLCPYACLSLCNSTCICFCITATLHVSVFVSLNVPQLRSGDRFCITMSVSPSATQYVFVFVFVSLSVPFSECIHLCAFTYHNLHISKCTCIIVYMYMCVYHCVPASASLCEHRSLYLYISTATTHYFIGTHYS